MLIKTLTSHSHIPAKLVHYAQRGGQSGHALDFEIVQNGTMPTAYGAIKAMDEQKQYTSGRKREIQFYHIVVAAHPKDTQCFLDHPQAFREYVEKVIQLRFGPEAVVYARLHPGKHLHCHIIAHSHKLHSREKLRISKSRFVQWRKEAEAYQKAAHPGIKHSLVYLDQKDRKLTYKEADQNRRKQREIELKRRRPNELTKKEKLLATVRDCFDRAEGIDHFMHLLIQHDDIEISRRKNRKITGLLHEGKYKYRWNRIGITKQLLQELADREMTEIERRTQRLNRTLARQRAKEKDYSLTRQL